MGEAIEAGRSRTAAALSQRSERPRWLQVAVVVGLVALATLMPLLRQTGTSSWRAIFPEDGSVYGQQAIVEGPFAVLFRGYAGYLQLPPRLLAIGAPLVPTRQLTLYFALAGSFVAALLGWFVYWATEGWIASTPLRLMLATLVVLAPVMGFENTANITNTIWPLAAVAPWALVSLRESVPATWARGAVGCIAATASPLLFLFVPLAVGWVLFRRTRSAFIVGCSMGAGLLVQGVVLLHTHGGSNPFIPTGGTLEQLRDRLTYRVFGELVIGPRWIGPLWRGNWQAVEIATTMIVLLALVVLLPGAGRRAQVLAVVMVGYSVVLFLVPLYGRGALNIPLVQGGPVFPFTMRFSVVPCFLLSSALAVLIASPERAARTWPRRVGWLLIAQTSLLITVSFASFSATSTEPNWVSEVDSARQDCAHQLPGRSIVVHDGLYPVELRCGDLGG